MYDALFEWGQVANLEVMRTAAAKADPGLPALSAALGASGAYLVTHPALGQLLFWRPIPQFQASDEAMAASHAMLVLQRGMLRDAIDAGQLGPAADSDEAISVLGSIICGVWTMATANEPGVKWGEGRFTPCSPNSSRCSPRCTRRSERSDVVGFKRPRTSAS